MNNKIINTHDSFFKSLFSNKNGVKEFVSKTINPNIVENLDLNTLKIDNTEYLDNHLNSSFSDLVYNCKYGKTDIKISLLFEHKSQPEKFPHFQLLGYMLQIWKLQIKQNEELTPVIPIIFYHGKKKWDNKGFENYFGQLDNEIQNFIPKFNYELIDTSTYSDNELKEHFDSIELQVGLLIMKNIFDEHKMLEKIGLLSKQINELLQTEEGKHFFDSISVYMLNATKITSDKYKEIMENISTQAKQQFVSTAQKLRFEGIKKGIDQEKKEIAIKMISKGYSNKTIIELTDLKENDVENIRKEYINQNK
ncbi:MAG: Rpn family recombination-promoting nuclease/putative transposase [Bacteroidota bacterium]|nr:Rpn family recombination-promoting nuclease/putative transposase [Bacteroidota bacterium]